MLEHILVPLDGSSLAECVLPHVVAVARAADSRVTLLRVLERAQPSQRSRFIDPLRWHMGAAEARAYLDDPLARLQAIGLRAERELLEGPAAERIIEYVHGNAVDLIVLSSHGLSGLSGWNVSGIVLKIILRAYVPVMIVRAYQPASTDLAGHRYKRLLVPLDCSKRAECVLPLASGLARFHGSEVVVAHVVSQPQMICRAPPSQEDQDLVDRIVERNRAEAERYLRQLKPQLDVSVDSRVLISDHPTAALHDLVEQAGIDLVLLSAHGHSGSTQWPYGSLVVNFISYGTTPLLIVQDLPPGEIDRTLAEVSARERKGH
jgi:nucleotide-binding universal stress UspA family protein